MGKVKDYHFDDINNMNQMFVDFVDWDYQYEESVDSEENIDVVNVELDELKLEFSTADISGALKYAFDSIIVEPAEVGLDVYKKLLEEKFYEYLNSIRF